MTMKSIKKRDGRTVAFDPAKIQAAIMKSFEASGSAKGPETAEQLTQRVVEEFGEQRKHRQRAHGGRGAGHRGSGCSSKRASSAPPRRTSFIAPSAAGCGR